MRSEAIDRVLVFTRTKHGADKVVRRLVQSGIAAEAIHGNKSQGQRERVLAAFRNGKVRTLVATDIAARGIDVDGISHVVNFDLPNVPETYVHRIGRTARAGAGGIAISLCDGEERHSCATSRSLSASQFRRAIGARIAASRRWQTRRPLARLPMARAKSGIGIAAMAPANNARSSNRETISNREIISNQATRESRPLPSCIATTRKGAAKRETRRGGSAAQEDHNVPKEELLEFEGLVTEILPDARYRVQLENGHQLIAYTAGRMKKNRIKTLAGDRVTVEVSPYDLEKGRLIFRHKDERAAPGNRPPQRNQFRRR